MTSPFRIVDLPSRHWAVSWPDMKPIKDVVTVNKLFELVNDINTGWEVGFGIELVGTKKTNDLEICWVTQEILLDKHSREQYGDWLCTMYNVLGVIFFKESEARQLLYELEKKLTWKTLQAQYD